MTVTGEQARALRLRRHHLDRPLPSGALVEAAAVCGVQNSPPGAWETALRNRVEGVTLHQLEQALYGEKTLLQAWSIRGVPLVFPTKDAGVFLFPLCAQPGEEPWVYTRGITGALDALGLDFYDLLPLAEEACACLEGETVLSKEALDRRLAGVIEPLLPPEVRPAWNSPSMYGQPDRQTVGGAAVSFLLRPCSFRGKVVFGAREGIYPTFTSPARWLGRPLPDDPDGAQELVRRFLRCYGPAQVSDFQSWLGCSPKQAKRLWGGIAEELAPVELDGKRRWVLAEDLDLLAQGEEGERLLLLGPHDPYLDLRDRDLILPDKARQRQVWKTVGNPGAVLLGGRVVGFWTVRTRGDKLDAAVTLFEAAVARPALPAGGAGLELRGLSGERPANVYGFVANRPGAETRRGGFCPLRKCREWLPPAWAVSSSRGT